MKTVIFKLISALLLLGLMGWGCEKENEYEDIPLEYMKCPCEHETDIISEISLDNILLFDADKTSMLDMRKLSLKENSSLFISYSSNSDSIIYYSFKEISNVTYVGIGKICNFPEIAKEWEISPNGDIVSLSAKVFEACDGSPSVGFKQTYTDNILTLLKRQIK
jgi:hypothetical protein